MANLFPGLKVGTDFSGWDTPVMSLRKIGIKFMHVFSSEIVPELRHLIRANSKPLKVYRSATRTPGMTLPCDLYVAGPPCQPWSTAGKGEGLSDSRGRGTLLWSTLDYLTMERPKAAVIENVRGLLVKHRDIFDQYLREFSGKGYDVFWSLINTMQHGLPHSRPRVYVVGFRSDLHVKTFKFPEPLRGYINIDQILRCAIAGPKSSLTKNAERRVREAKRSLKKKGVDVRTQPVFVDTSASKQFAHFSVGICPCITYSRGSCGGYYVTSLRRKLLLEDGHWPLLRAGSPSFDPL
jgi:DNA-cytosine methyltransferase